MQGLIWSAWDQNNWAAYFDRKRSISAPAHFASENLGSCSSAVAFFHWLETVKTLNIHYIPRRVFGHRVQTSWCEVRVQPGADYWWLHPLLCFGWERFLAVFAICRDRREWLRWPLPRLQGPFGISIQQPMAHKKLRRGWLQTVPWEDVPRKFSRCPPVRAGSGWWVWNISRSWPYLGW